VTIPCGEPIAIGIKSLPGHLPIVRAAAEKACELVGFDDDTRNRVVLSLDEALTNVIRHAYGGAGDQPIEIELTPLGDAAPEGLQIRLRDYGRTVDSSRIRPRDLEDVRPGGLGVHIMKECMDSVEYAAAEGGGTVLTMIKRVNPQDPETASNE
jgi:anti-sigma regulatory factor (Ser/Thr protein kinase)